MKRVGAEGVESGRRKSLGRVMAHQPLTRGMSRPSGPPRHSAPTRFNLKRGSALRGARRATRDAPERPGRRAEREPTGLDAEGLRRVSRGGAGQVRSRCRAQNQKRENDRTRANVAGVAWMVGASTTRRRAETRARLRADGLGRTHVRTRVSRETTAYPHSLTRSEPSRRSHRQTLSPARMTAVLLRSITLTQPLTRPLDGPTKLRFLQEGLSARHTARDLVVCAHNAKLNGLPPHGLPPSL